MRQSNYQFDESQWARPGTGIDYGQTEEVEAEIIQLKAYYPELSSWGDLAIFTAWGSFSQDQYELQWHPVMSRDEPFLGYLYYLEKGNDIMQWTDNTAQAALAEIFPQI